MGSTSKRYAGRLSRLPGPARERLYAFMTPNAVGASEYFQILSSRIVELGIQVFDFALQRR
jgi:K+ transporter